ncbi:MAG TPA: hypothetical protein VJ698_11060 [Noviherbaspirillum sp.]|uniref:hypothetical protein n=1 Tax=Noviherbaspirillum sp. TaxID=1926288 RepID=UPI002B493A6D|nr:hypothetical protein [Noviherbaspirillum sp.]HJV86002.1 hypothetical protein [Noviherbaspirillum sp.]
MDLLLPEDVPEDIPEDVPDELPVDDPVLALVVLSLPLPDTGEVVFGSMNRSL